jgi:hypothetical protein
MKPVAAPSVVGVTLFVLASLGMGTQLAGCAPTSEDAVPPHEDWIIESEVTFPEKDGRSAKPRPNESLRLWVPYVVGDIYGSPNAGEISPVDLRANLTFTMNLNLGYRKLARALVPTEFSQKWMSIEPKDARVARVSPFVMPADGIAPVGTCEWLDTDSGQRLLLIYVDRPARIRGDIVYEGRSLRFDIDAKEAGYLWVRQPENSGEFTVAARPKHLVLAVEK